MVLYMFCVSLQCVLVFGSRSSWACQSEAWPMYSSPLGRRPAPRVRSQWRVRDDIPLIERPGEQCEVVGHRVDRGQVFCTVRFPDNTCGEYLPGDLEVLSWPR